jgi:sialic acid synthase SpsE/mannose-6-phosphate isomerase-like protein (cupin superfamily)
MTETLPKPLFILEMANNHMGDVDHGLRIVREFGEIIVDFPEFRFGFKLQYRNLDTFIHPGYRNRTEFNYVKRFSETRLSRDALRRLKDAIAAAGFISICTPFDEASVDLIEEHDFDICKVASCSFTDWPLWERIAKTSKPLIVSTAGASIEEIDKVVSFLEHRKKNFILMHCVGAYPTPAAGLELNQIDLYRARYPQVPLGYSTHEEPDNCDAVKLAVAKGAVAFERHAGLATDRFTLNAYSSTPAQIRAWVTAAREAYAMCGVSDRRRDISEKERNDLRGLQRGVFVRDAVGPGEKIGRERVFFAIPNFPGQLVANDLSKYVEITAVAPIAPLGPVDSSAVTVVDSREKVLAIIKDIRALVVKSGIKLQNRIDFEISHHFGIDRFYRYGCTIMNIINREYCKKLILILAGQENPTHTHKVKEETFHVLYGDVWIGKNGKIDQYSAGDLVTIERNVPHSFGSKNGAIFEEISTTHIKSDSYYDDPAIATTEDRKTAMTFWIDWLEKPIR